MKSIASIFFALQLIGTYSLNSQIVNYFPRVITNDTYYLTAVGDTIDITDTICLGSKLHYALVIGNTIQRFDSALIVVDYNDTLRELSGEIIFSNIGLHEVSWILWFVDSKGTEYDGFFEGTPVYVIHCPPTISLTISDSTTCQNECININYKTTNTPETYEWYFEGAEPDLWLDDKPPPVCYKDTGTYTIKVVVSNPAGADTATATVYVAPGPERVVVDQNFQLNEGDEITLEACARGDSYAWQPLTAVTLNEDTLLSVQPDEATVYTASITTTNGCRADCVYDIKVLNGLLVPTGFSPNGDGVNDLFRIFNTNIKLNNLSIYNRWGNLVFSTTNLNEGWDGTYQNTEQELGVYTWTANYTITKSGKRKSAKGNVTLVR